jgi:NAD(P)-dependent dehydrogenase (short-subunit alcohol dehydrogenase family)
VGMLDGKVAIVTGAGRGIGRGEALELAAQGARVVVNDLGGARDGTGKDPSVAQAVVDEITSAGGEAVANADDVSEFDGAGAAIRQAVETWGQLDIVVNNAGITRDKMIFNLTVEDWDAVIKVHLRHTFCMTHHACVHWRGAAKASPTGKTYGRIINTASSAGLAGNVGQTSYGSAKAAIAAFTTIVAMEMSRYGVTANCVVPAARTRMTETVGASPPPAEGFDGMAPENVAPLVAWYASEDAHWVTGQVFRLIGGNLAHYRPWSLSPAQNKPGRWTADEIGMGVRRIFGTYPGGIQI